MVAKKKTVKTEFHEETPSVSLEESVAEEERKPVVTQVVEVVEDGSTGDTQTAASLPTLEDASVSETPVSAADTTSSKEQDAMRDEKRKELVDELFEKPASSPVIGTPEISVHRTTKPNPIVFWAIGIVAGCVAVGAGLFFFSGKESSFPSITLKPSPTSTALPATPTPTVPQVTRDSVSVQVLNGGGVTGAASKMKSVLEEKGYTVSNTGNAESYTYDKTEVLVKSSKASILPLLEEDLKSSYTLGTTAATLEETDEYDVRVTVGKE